MVDLEIQKKGCPLKSFPAQTPNGMGVVEVPCAKQQCQWYDSLSSKCQINYIKSILLLLGEIQMKLDKGELKR